MQGMKKHLVILLISALTLGVRDFGMPAERAVKLKPFLQSLEQIVKALYDEGVPIVAGGFAK
jgi:hypothetical protein